MSGPDGERGGISLALAVEDSYRRGQTDYSMEPLVLEDRGGEPIGRISDGDSVVFCCRRGEREIQLTEAFTDPMLDKFPRRPLPNLAFVILTLYHERFKDLPVAFAPKSITGTLGEAVSAAGLRQLRVAESEKFAHVTFFLNGGDNRPFRGQDSISVPSPRGIPFDQLPELSLPRVADEVIAGIDAGYDLIVANFANGDVIGHSHNPQAKVRCAEAVDSHMGRVLDAARAAGCAVIVTADHGILEEMAGADGTPNTSHTANPVPLVVLDPGSPAGLPVSDGRLADVAPTVLALMGVPAPGEMDGRLLLPEAASATRRRVVLLILDGWGIGRGDETNPICLAASPVWDEITRTRRVARLQASGEAVGLRTGKAGNSEAGHVNIGAGRVVLQDDVRLDAAMKDGSFYANPVLLAAIDRARDRGANLHLIGLLTAKSSHGSIDYPLALLHMARARGLDKVFVHVIFDGRSTEPGSAPALLAGFDRAIGEIGVGQIVSGMGRGIALDRDGNYAKTRLAYDALVLGTGKRWPASHYSGAKGEHLRESARDAEELHEPS